MGELDEMGDGQEEGTYLGGGKVGTAGTQAGGWLLFYCCGGSVLLYVRVNVKRGEGKQGNGVLASCWQLPCR